MLQLLLATLSQIKTLRICLSTWLYSLMRTYILSLTQLELGGGSGLTSMVASLLGADVYVCLRLHIQNTTQTINHTYCRHSATLLVYDRLCTEQESSVAYLKKNSDMNPDIKMKIGNFSWLNKNKRENGQKFDIILGCDITYDLKYLKPILTSIRDNLNPIDGFALLCHDNDSCPLSKFAYGELLTASADLGLLLTEVNYGPFTNSGFRHDLVQMWKVVHVSKKSNISDTIFNS